MRWTWPRDGFDPNGVVRSRNKRTGEIVQGPARAVLRYVMEWARDGDTSTIEPEPDRPDLRGATP